MTHGDPAPRGGWFEPNNTQGRRRVEWLFRVGGAVLGLCVTLGVLASLLNPETGPADRFVLVLLTVGALVGGALTYLATDWLGLALTAVSWRALFHDLRLRSVWVLLLEIALFLSVLPMEWYSILDAYKHGSVYSGLVALQLFALTFWPFLRHRIRHSRWPDQR